MKHQLFKGDGQPRSIELPPAKRKDFQSVQHYTPDEGLVNAVNVALMLGQPLLLTGEPGTGKTQLAYYLAWELGLKAPLKFETKSDSQASDLFYSYDSLKRFQQAQSGSASDSALPYITFNALGKAILHSCERDEVAGLLANGVEHPGPVRSVVLIDEVDKAPRDFPNDILNELDSLYFKIPELGNREVGARPGLEPIVVLTSNSEKDLPDAFLRRCIFYHIPFPGESDMRDIVSKRLQLDADQEGDFLGKALDLFYRLRKNLKRKRPSTSELLEWITAMKRMMPDATDPLAADPHVALWAISALGKAVEDQPEAHSTVRGWIQEQT